MKVIDGKLFAAQRMTIGYAMIPFDSNMSLPESTMNISIYSIDQECPFRYLHLSGDTYGRPIHGQKEISGYSYPNSQNLWKVDAGVYIRPSSEPLSSTRDENSNTYSKSNVDHFDDEL